MSINLNPETERLVKEELRNGNFHSVDEIILHGIRAKHEKRADPPAVLDRNRTVERALDFAKRRAIPLRGASIKELLHQGHRL